MNSQSLIESFSNRISAPTQPVIYYQTRGQISGGEFTARVMSLAECLLIHKEHKWLLWADSSGDFLIQFSALCVAGKHIIMPGNIHTGTLASLNLEFEAILSDQAIAPGEYNADKPSVILEDIVANPAPGRIEPRVSAKDVAITLFTSGTTGEPKAIAKSLAQILFEIEAQQQLWSDRVHTHCVVSTVSHQHIYGLIHACLWPFWRGAAFYAEIHQYPEELMSVALKHEPCVLVSSPTHLKRLPQSDVFVRDSRSIVTIFSSTGLLNQQASAEIESCCQTAPIEIFGSTETGGVAWRQQGDLTEVPWHPLPGCELSKNESSGCLQVESKHAGIQLQEMGDRVKFNEDGTFFILGRSDKIVKVEGKRLSITEIEGHLAAHEWVNEARVIVLKRKREEVSAVIVLSDAAPSLEKKSLNSTLKQHLAQYYERILIPRRWRYLSSLPEDPQGKVTFAVLENCFNNVNEP